MASPTSPMEKILNNPGLVHLAENIFGNFDAEKLNVCKQINQSLKQILANPNFWLKKFTALSKANQKDWIEAIQSVKNTDKENAISSYLQWKLKKDALLDLPCYSSPVVQFDFRKRIRKIFGKRSLSNKGTEIVKILAPLTDNPNAPDQYGETPILWAACNGYTEIVKILAPLTDNPNAPNEEGETPIYWAARHGWTHLYNKDGENTICGEAHHNGYTEIVKILAPLTDNPNAPNEEGETPIYWAARHGSTEIVKILAPFDRKS